MHTGGALRALLERLVVLGDPAADVCGALFRAVTAATDLASAAGAGAVLADTGEVLHVIASSSERTSDVEEAELGIVQGPCLEAYRSGGLVDVPDFASRADDWPDVFRIAQERGFGGVYAVPLNLRGRTIGTICAFSPQGAAFTDTDASLLHVIADTAVAAVAQRIVLQGRTLDELIELALEQRDRIEQAKGALSYRRSVPIDHAFRIRHAGAQRAGLSLARTAHQVITEGHTL
ncbi:GAF and ANTAR domain-containing protein [Curtobacterium sp. MCPF17_002]|uniref:GAF and ANTAR domain-containing protein n=1 Tax=Curtobacterium sp. MCPF17_002 TaxID=2175645 RepID=UPI000DAA1A98|nr:GAF and ANTAR domain-containing protein [Curtobacterium sp. MCPF17_002]WIB77979.1 GAF and ANTAR domain-containing protein [Curtobacterium sp. MCPF17_002]